MILKYFLSINNAIIKRNIQIDSYVLITKHT